MSIEEQIGAKIRNLRNQNGLTQEELADRTELTKGFISQMERGLTAPSVSTLLDIVECLGTNLSDFFHEENELQIVYPKEDYFEKEDEHKNSITWLIATAQSRSMEPILVQLQPGQSMPEDKPHEGEEFGYVLDGEIRLHYGEDVYTVRKGDSFIFPANRKHKISSACKKVSSVLWISSPPSF
ncbi:XRE family transcriptional regulator [Mediterraneibacter glycyrrhizinilyticus]|uniref:helix-turn-helix domain-containing protein n=1 Tax=Mediterraneibacter glycyrrhizinilyticus TaxID=342942 RepID=UPI001D07F983|nr:XRE family transcriptional regulator [Mediterraneibacter glycyrrhizinilyticus]MCB6309143.1 XRE family transcriptional regulator [Lachnospiraceae bacterium 210521-DFI.1.109]MCB6426489.1 XRE family transcriptional regulator [Mediterraneibacter glycyrrhizinilyticus]